MSFQPYSPAPASNRARNALAATEGVKDTYAAMGFIGAEREKRREIASKYTEKSGKFMNVAPVGSQGFAGKGLGEALGGLLNQGGSQPWYETSNFSPAGNTFSGFSGGSQYRATPSFSQYKPPGWNPSSTVFGS